MNTGETTQKNAAETPQTTEGLSMALAFDRLSADEKRHILEVIVTHEQHKESGAVGACPCGCVGFTAEVSAC